jgi:hypothetical protein
MLVIVVTVITQGPRVPADMRGPIKSSLIINDGVFQAIGVISFGQYQPHVINCITRPNLYNSICLSYVALSFGMVIAFFTDMRASKKTTTACSSMDLYKNPQWTVLQR